MELRDYLSALRHRWFTVALCAILGLAASVLYNSSVARTYQADARSFVSVVSGSTTVDSNSIYAASQFALQRMKSYTELGDSNQALEPVLTSLGLHGSVSDLAKHVTVTNPAATVVLDIAVTYSDPVEAAKIANAVADSLGKVIQNLELTSPGGTSPVVVTVTKRAVPVATPVTPRTTLDLALGLVVGLCLGLALALLRERLDRSLKTPTDITDVVGAPPLGLLGRKLDSDGDTRPDLDEQGVLVETESLRSIRTSLALLNHDELPQRLVICSIESPLSIATATGLAEVAAVAGASVCIVEADLRHPRLAAFLGVEPRGGLAAILSGKADLEAELDQIPSRPLTILAAGSGATDPGSMLGFAHMHNVLEDLSILFDFVLVIAPPLFAAEDARVVSRQTDGVLLICDYGKTSRGELTTAIESLHAAGCELLGTVLAGVPKRQRRGFDHVPSLPPASKRVRTGPVEPATAQPIAERPIAERGEAKLPVVEPPAAQSPPAPAAVADDGPQADQPGARAADAAVEAWVPDRTVRRPPRRPATRPRLGLRSGKGDQREDAARSVNEDEYADDVEVSSSPDSR